MGNFSRSHCAVALSMLFALCSARILQPNDDFHYDDTEVAMIGKRQVEIPAQVSASATAQADATVSASVLTYVTPLPGRSPVAVTQASQIVTSWAPQFSLCELPPLAQFSISPVSSQTPLRKRSLSASTPTGSGTCKTIYEPTITMVCATTLTALDRTYVVTKCNEEITFSTQYGYVLAKSTSTAGAPTTITPAPAIETLTTYYLAPWQQLGAGTAPSEVDLEVCRTFDNGSTECIREYQVWSTSLVTSIATTVTSVNISTTIAGASQLIVGTFTANVTETLTTFSLSTTMNTEFSTVFMTTNSFNVSSRTSTPSFLTTQTRTLLHATPSSTSSLPSATDTSDDGGDSTSIVHVTSTVVGGTRTVTVTPKPASLVEVATASINAETSSEPT